MDKWVKNPTGSSRNYEGQTVAAAAYHQLTDSQLEAWRCSSQMVNELSGATAIMSRDGTAAGDITDVSKAVDFLKDVGLEVKVKEESVTTITNLWKDRGYDLPVPGAAQWHILKDISFPFPMNNFSALFYDLAGMEDDCVRVEINPETAVTGAKLDAAASSGNTVLTVSSEMIAAAKIAYHVIIGSEEHEIIGMDATTITIAAGLAGSHAIDTALKLSYRMIDDHPLGGVNQAIAKGMGTLGGSLLATGHVMRIKYKNSNTTEKKLKIALEVKN
jgi:hypothetical protein